MKTKIVREVIIGDRGFSIRKLNYDSYEYRAYEVVIYKVSKKEICAKFSVRYPSLFAVNQFIIEHFNKEEGYV